jgi:hypothetical protein
VKALTWALVWIAVSALVGPAVGRLLRRRRKELVR